MKHEPDPMHHHDRSRHRTSTLLIAMMVTLATTIIQVPGTTPAYAAEVVDSVFIDGDIIEPQPYASAELFDAPRLQTLSAGDPLNLVLKLNELRRYSLGTDVFEVWECPDAGPLSMTAAQFAVDAEANVSPYFSWLSAGRYNPDFIVGGVVPSGEDCSTYARKYATGRANAALFIRSTAGGRAGPGNWCLDSYSSCPTTYPDNAREGFIGINSVVHTTLAHEMGHMLSWPHSSTKVSTSNYDNAIDLMSGNYGIWSTATGTRWGTYPIPYATVGISRYGAGWYDTGEVVVWDGTDTVVTVGVTAGTGNQLVVVDEGTRYYTFDLRISQTPDPFPTAWTGIEVYEVERCSGCWGLNAQVTPVPPVPFDWKASTSYSQPLPHVLVEGGSISLATATVTFVQRAGATATLRISPTAAAVSPTTTRFLDVPETHAFFADVEWLADMGITKGCNPPTDDLFCPDSAVTRAQMAAFLVRALELAATSTDFFIDDDVTVFEADINRLAAAGITKGCNPPAGDRFCPDSLLTRAQMAALLVRALGYSDAGGGDLFIDDDGSIFETDIDRLATAGVTKGCNPPTNDRFCPNALITRAQMAAFLHRALG